MEKEKNNGELIALIIILVVLVLGLGGYLVFDKVLNTKPVNNNVENTDNNFIEKQGSVNNQEANYDIGYDNYIKFVVDNSNIANQCQNINNKNYYSVDNSYVVFVNNLSIKNKNYTFRYAVDNDARTVKVYLNDKLAFDGKKGEAILIDVCNYGNYLAYSVGFEGSPYYRIINTDGKIVMSFTGYKVSYLDGMLNVEELNKNDSSNLDDNELIKYQLDMNSDDLQKLNITTEKYVCDRSGPGYDC